ncbi:putative Ig domain-containing protein, partial [Rhizobium johnstonii]
SGLTLQVAAASQSSAAGLVYSQVPGTTLPTGYSISPSGLVTVGPASQMQTNVTVAVRATDGHGLYADRTFTFVPSGTPRA